MWGAAKEKSFNTLALCSESTGKANFAEVSVGTTVEATAKAKAGSLPVTPCMELPGDPSVSAITLTLTPSFTKYDFLRNENVCWPKRVQNNGYL